MPRKYTPAEREAAFWARVNKDGPTQPHMETCCWVWTGGLVNGYGRTLSIEQGKPVYTHRLAWEITNGRTLTADEVARHDCDYRPCCNPAHIQPGTQLQNVRDMMDRGRSAHVQDLFRGPGLTAEMVREIRASAAEGQGAAALAARHGVCYATIRQVINRQSWRKVV